MLHSPIERAVPFGQFRSPVHSPTNLQHLEKRLPVIQEQDEPGDNVDQLDSPTGSIDVTPPSGTPTMNIAFLDKDYVDNSTSKSKEDDIANSVQRLAEGKDSGIDLSSPTTPPSLAYELVPPVKSIRKITPTPQTYAEDVATGIHNRKNTRVTFDPLIVTGLDDEVVSKSVNVKTPIPSSHTTPALTPQFPNSKLKTPLQRHIDMFDKSHTGIIYPFDTFTTLNQDFGINWIISSIFTIITHIICSYMTQPRLIPTLRDILLQPIYVERIDLVRFGSALGVLRSESALARFELPGSTLTFPWIDHKLKAVAAFMDVIGWFVVRIKWMLVIIIGASRNGWKVDERLVKSILDGRILTERRR